MPLSALMRVVHSLGFDVTVIAAFPSLDRPQGSSSFSMD
jgi:hypothetical protein